MPRRERTNLTTLAERLGVSISTVSRALRGMEGIHPETRSRIIALSHQMGYSSKSPAVGPMTSELERDPRHILAKHRPANRPTLHGGHQRCGRIL